MKKVLVCGAGGFIGSHMVKGLKSRGYYVKGVDVKYSQYWQTAADEFEIVDLRDQQQSLDVAAGFDEVYQLAADMGGAGFVFTGENDADIMSSSTQINLNVIGSCLKHQVKKIFFSSSACVYPERNQLDPDNPVCAESSVYPAEPDSEYGWEKLFSERLYLNFHKNYGLGVRIARYHNVYGPYGTYQGGREKAPAAMCRKVLEASDNGVIEVWGPGTQTRSFLYVDDAVDATIKLMDSDFIGPVNIGSEEMVTINQLAELAIAASGKHISIKNIPGPIGVNGRRSDNRLVKEKLNWEPRFTLKQGMQQTYKWISNEYSNNCH